MDPVAQSVSAGSGGASDLAGQAEGAIKDEWDVLSDVPETQLNHWLFCRYVRLDWGTVCLLSRMLSIPLFPFKLRYASLYNNCFKVWIHKQNKGCGRVVFKPKVLIISASQHDTRCEAVLRTCTNHLLSKAQIISMNGSSLFCALLLFCATCQKGRNVLRFIQLIWREASVWVKSVLQTYQSPVCRVSPRQGCNSESFICQWPDGAPCLCSWQTQRNKLMRQGCRNSWYLIGGRLAFWDCNQGPRGLTTALSVQPLWFVCLLSEFPQCTHTAQPRGHTGTGEARVSWERGKENEKSRVSYLAEHAL